MRIVLREMFDNKRINYTQWMQARDEKEKVRLRQNVGLSRARFIEERRKTERWKAPYFVSYVKQYLQKQYGWSDEYLNKSGLQIYTTVDPKLQSIADMVMRDGVHRSVDGSRTGDGWWPRLLQHQVERPVQSRYTSQATARFELQALPLCSGYGSWFHAQLG
jgi:membrane peptidoglycan carboxypeptidase